MPVTVKLNKLPAAKPAMMDIPIKLPAASRSESSTQSAAEVMSLEHNQPLVKPNGNWTRNK